MAERLGLDVWTSGRGKVSGLGAGGAAARWAAVNTCNQPSRRSIAQAGSQAPFFTRLEARAAGGQLDAANGMRAAGEGAGRRGCTTWRVPGVGVPAAAQATGVAGCGRLGGRASPRQLGRTPPRPPPNLRPVHRGGAQDDWARVVAIAPPSRRHRVAVAVAVAGGRDAHRSWPRSCPRASGCRQIAESGMQGPRPTSGITSASLRYSYAPHQRPATAPASQPPTIRRQPALRRARRGRQASESLQVTRPSWPGHEPSTSLRSLAQKHQENFRATAAAARLGRCAMPSVALD